jgi:hypothetical protein
MVPSKCKFRLASCTCASVLWVQASVVKETCRRSFELQELTKLHAFEEQFALASKAQATKFGLPEVTLDELPATMDPIQENITVSAGEVKWILQSARQQAESMRKSNPKFADPYSTPEFTECQETIAERLGMSSEQLKKAQEGMSSTKWREVSSDAGVAL